MNRPDRRTLLTGVDELASWHGDRQLRIIDCRFDLTAPDAGRQAWLDAHIRGAVYADLDHDLSGPVTPDSGRHPLPSVEQAAETFSRLGIDAHTRVVAYDDASGAIAARAWWLLRWLGHDQVTVLDGGIQAWRSAGLPMESGPYTVERRGFHAEADAKRVLNTPEIVSHVQSDVDLMLLDARDAARFRGEVEPIDTRAGHIPGTGNLPYAACLATDGTWLREAALQDRFAPLLGDAPGVPWAVMCGSGVTACHLAISGLLAGYAEPRLYVGSWSEWIRDPARPIGPAAVQ